MIHATLKSIQFLFLFFVLHRVAIFPFIYGSVGTQAPSHMFQAFLVGLMSDLWIACLGSCILACLEILLIIIRLGRFCSYFRKAFLVSVIAVTSIHYSYVGFFHYPVIPLHLSYLTDTAFLRGNFSSVFSPGVLLSFFAGLLGLYALHPKPQPGKNLRQGLITLFVLLVGVGVHVLHIRYKIQWFIPEPLQYNLFEGLAFKAGHNPRATSLTAQELSLLQDLYGVEGNDPDPGKALEALHFSDSTEGNDPGFAPLLQKLEESVTASVRDGKKPLLLTVLMESFRASDTGAYGSGDSGLTPAFDQLAEQGVLFRRAYSVSNVTRGGQEAVWCGYLSSQGRSAMRDRTDLPVSCLPERITRGETFWIHGGEGRFDGQKIFWKKHGVRHLVAQEDLPGALARTGWGIGDYSLNKIAANKISGLHESSSGDYLFGMILSVSNHIPWDVPADTPSRLNSHSFTGSHPSEKTVLYADMALGRLADSLREAGLWENTLMVVAGDHGIRAPALNEAFKGISPGEQISHISLLVSGGLVEKALENLPSEARVWDGVVSQADIAPFWARVLGIKDFRSMGESLLKTKRIRPVFSDLGSTVYFPQSEQELPVSSLLSGGTPAGSDAARLFYRSLIQWIDIWSLQQNRLADSVASPPL